MAFSATNHKLVTPLPITTNATPKIFTLSTAYEYQPKMFPLAFVINVIWCRFTSDFNDSGRKKNTNGNSTENINGCKMPNEKLIGKPTLKFG